MFVVYYLNLRIIKSFHFF